MRRLYLDVIKEHFANYNKMLFLAGPRQVGKTTLAMSARSIFKHTHYLNWDNDNHRRLIFSGPKAIAEYTKIQQVQFQDTLIIFDELHKYSNWKNFIKGFFDTYHQYVRIIVTGSAKLNIYRAGGDSMMGRYFLHQIHPFSIAECIRPTIPKQEISSSTKVSDNLFKQLLDYGGYPEPFLANNKRLHNRWRKLLWQQLFREDLRDLTNIRELDRIELLANLLHHQAGQLLNQHNLANKIGLSSHTINNWIQTLTRIYYCFIISPWHNNISRSLLKQPKVYLWDWSQISDEGIRMENFVACHLFKAIQFWNDNGFGDYGLYFLRDKEKREVDFVVTKNHHPWLLIEVKKSSSSISKNLILFQKQLNAKHAFQVVFDQEYIDIDCFKLKHPTIVPVQTLLSQLI